MGELFEFILILIVMFLGVIWIRWVVREKDVQMSFENFLNYYENSLEQKQFIFDINSRVPKQRHSTFKATVFELPQEDVPKYQK